MSNFLSKHFQTAKILQVIVAPIALLFCYSFVLVVSTPYLPGRSVNLVFLNEFAQISGILTGISLAIVAVMYVMLPNQKLTESPETIGLISYLMIVVLTLSWVIRYLIANSDIVSIYSAVLTLGIFAFPAIASIISVPYFLRKVASDKMLVASAGAFGFILLNMVLISQSFKWYIEGDIVIQVAILLTAFIVIRLLLELSEKDLAMLVIVFVIGSTIIQLIPTNNGETSDSEIASNTTTTDRPDSNLDDLIPDTPLDTTPNVYLLIYDSYVPNEIMQNYGIDNSAHEQYLVERGFTLYPQTYSIGSHSLASMDTMLNASSQMSENRPVMDGNHTVQNVFRSNGYQIISIYSSDYFFRGIDSVPNYDYFVPSEMIPVHELLSSAIWRGEFRFEFAVEGLQQPEFVAEKRNVFNDISDDPRFIYAHSMLPQHSRNVGACSPEEEVSLYSGRLVRANQEMEGDLDAIISNDPNAIIIVAGDHGPYLTKNCLYLQRYAQEDIGREDLQDRHGAFLAIRWSGENFEAFDDITVIQDVFPALFATLYDDSAILDARSSAITIENHLVGGLVIDNGIIIGGANDGEPFYLSQAGNDN